MNTVEMGYEAARLAPAATTPVMSFLGYGVAEWASLATLTYAGMLIVWFLWTKLIRPWLRSKKRQDE